MIAGAGLVYIREHMDEPHTEPADEAARLASESLAARNAGDLGRALEHAQACLELRTARLGEGHVDTAAAFGLVAAARRRRGELDAALAADLRALAIYEDILGHSHADTATAAGNLSATRRVRGEHDEALALARRALAGLLAGLGAACEPGDLRVALAWGNLAAVHRARGEHPQAIAAGRELLAIRQAMLGDRHLDTAAAHSLLGSLHAAAGDHGQAALAEQAALELREAAGDRRAALESLINLATIHRNLGDAARSLELQQRALAAQRTLLGEGDPATTRSRLYVAYTMLRIGRRREAEQLIAEGLRHDPRSKELHQLKQQLDSVVAPGFRAAPTGAGPRAAAGKNKPRGRGKR